MGKMGTFHASDLKKLQARLNKIKTGETQAFVEECARELAARLLAKVIKRTPVGEYPKGSGKKGGTLRRGWTSRQPGSGAEGRKTSGAKSYADSLKINHYGNFLVVEIINPVEYASYVEYGHRTADHRGWVQGHFMLTISEQEIQEAAPRVLESKIRKFLGECMR